HYKINFVAREPEQVFMKNMVDYVTEANLSFENKKFTAVDSLVLSQLAYLNYDGIVPGLSESVSPVPIQEVAAVENPGALFQDVRESKSNRQLFSAFVNSPRFCNTKLAFYVNQFDGKMEKQFSAVTFLLDDNSAYIAFRGTDSSLVGWKEDFNMAFTSPIPSQQEGVAYLNAAADKIPRKLRIGGHSKGGNIAVYSAVYCRRSVENRIVQIFSHDGPGFREEVFHSEGYRIIKDRIHKTLPQSSMIGMLLHHQEKYSVVESNRIWLMQHDPFSWQIDGDHFRYIPSITKSALYMNGTLNQWVDSFDDQKRELFVNTLFQIIQATDAATFYDLAGDWPKRALALLGAMKEIDDDTRSFLFETIRSLFVLAAKNIREAGKSESV
ncbi:MAG TPA: DUF2974 domain-containing protein, partial [Feifaniaceae bacterium]|nr:DUF2974 domain-containing protein [Feifaniaceae bacterium]